MDKETQRIIQMAMIISLIAWIAYLCYDLEKLSVIVKIIRDVYSFCAFG